MKRRQFIALLGSVAAAWPLAARAQQPAMPVIGFLSSGASDKLAPSATAFREGLKETGYVEGQNVAIEYRWAGGHYDQLPALAVDLVGRQVAVIVATTIQAALPAKAATATIPIVFAVGSDPVEVGLVASFNRPGGNLTGVSSLTTSIVAKRLELLHEVVPKVGVVAALVNPSNPNIRIETKELHEGAQALGLRLQVLNASTGREIDSAFENLVQEGAGALLVATDAFFASRAGQLLPLAEGYAVPAIYEWREFAVVGGLMSYGTNWFDVARQTGVYAGKILKGAKPADLPVQQSTKVELVINLKTAKALGLTFPLSLLGRADEVIE
jgi:putative ABC transport system substrate-binding protein